MAGRMQNRDLDRAGLNRGFIVEVALDFAYLGHRAAYELRLHREHLIEKPIGLMNSRRGTGPALEVRCGTDVVDMGMGMDDGGDAGPGALKTSSNRREIAAWINDNRALARRVDDDGAVAAKVAYGERLNNHEGV